MKVAMLGAGAWGTALSLVLARNKCSVRIWTYSAEQAAELREKRSTDRLPGIALPENWEIFTDINSAIRGVDAVIAAIPSKSFREVVSQLSEVRCPIVSVTKGIEYESGMTMTKVLESCVPHARRAALSSKPRRRHLESARGVRLRDG